MCVCVFCFCVSFWNSAKMRALMLTKNAHKSKSITSHIVVNDLVCVLSCLLFVVAFWFVAGFFFVRSFRSNPSPFRPNEPADRACVHHPAALDLSVWHILCCVCVWSISKRNHKRKEKKNTTNSTHNVLVLALLIEFQLRLTPSNRNIKEKCAAKTKTLNTYA